MVIRSNIYRILILSVAIFTCCAVNAQYTWESDAVRPIAPAYRIMDRPFIIDTIIPTPNVVYPLLNRSLNTQISIDQIEASKIKIVDKLDKLYPGYLRLGVGNYTSPIGEFYYNSGRHRKMTYGVHLNHNSSFGKIKGWAPQTYDNSNVRVFGEFRSRKLVFGAEGTYLLNGYHFYGIRDSSELISKDSLTNRVQGMNAGLRLSNYSDKDSAKLMWRATTNYMYFHEFRQNSDPFGRNARNHNYFFGAEFWYKLKIHTFKVDADVRVNRYWAAESDTTLADAYRMDTNNTLIHVNPFVTTYLKNWKFVYGVHMYADFPSNETPSVLPCVEAKLKMFNGLVIPYFKADGKVIQNSFYTLNRQNKFIVGSVDLKNTRIFQLQAGFKGTLSKTMSFNVAAHFKRMNNQPLFINDTVFSDLYKFTVVYDRIDAYGGVASLSYQSGEKLKIDGIVEYNKYITDDQEFAWHMPELKISLRGNYNLYDKLSIRADVGIEAIRKSPVYLYNPADDDIIVDLGTIVDGNLHLEYRYNKRMSVFLQLSNIGAQKYYRWYNYRVQGFQILGGATFAF